MFDFLSEGNVYILYYLAVVPVVVIFGFVARARQKARYNKWSKEDYLSKYPDAAKVYLTNKAFITSEAVQVLSVNGEAPHLFAEEGSKTGFYAKPGSNVIAVDYTYTRPGIMYKNVTKTTGEVTQEIEVEPYGAYLLGFDRKEECFTFDKLSDAAAAQPAGAEAEG